MRRIIALSLSFMMIIAFTEGCKTVKEAAYSPVGTWDYQIPDTPMGTITGKFILAKVGDGYKMTMTGDQGSSDVKDFKMEGNAVSGNFESQGYTVDLTGNFEGESFKGIVSAAGYEFPVTASRSGK